MNHRGHIILPTTGKPVVFAGLGTEKLQRGEKGEDLLPLLIAATKRRP